jgi:hypothetical protein
MMAVGKSTFYSLANNDTLSERGEQLYFLLLNN